MKNKEKVSNYNYSPFVSLGVIPLLTGLAVKPANARLTGVSKEHDIPFSTISKESIRDAYSTQHNLKKTDYTLVENSLRSGYDPIRQNTINGHIGPTKIFLENKAGASTLAHELGHAVDYKKAPMIKFRSRIYGPLAAFGTVSALTNKNEDNRKYTGPILMAGAAPMLYQEGKASLIAQKVLKNMGASSEVLKNSSKSLRAAFGTYALAIAAPVLATHYFINKKKNKN